MTILRSAFSPELPPAVDWLDEFDVRQDKPSIIAMPPDEIPVCHRDADNLLAD